MKRILRDKRGFVPFAIFWIIGVVIIFGRISFDIKGYFFGNALAYRDIQGTGYDYLIHLPKGYTDFGGKRPLLIYLHGSGETGIGLRELKKRDLIHCLGSDMDSKDFPFIVVCPMTPIKGWRPKLIIRLLDEIIADTGKRWELDESRIYMTGMSMGGFGTFRTACEFPGRFAAIAPVAGGGDIDDAEKLQRVPTWAFHGNADDVVPYEMSSKMIEVMLEIECREAKLTTLEGAGHGIMYDVYSKQELYRWMLKHERY